jgi:pilus assembly protein TadC
MSREIREAASRIATLAQDYEQESLTQRKILLLNQISQEIKTMENQLKGSATIKVDFLERNKLINELKIDATHLNEAIFKKEKRKFYTGNLYGKISNLFFEHFTKKIINNFPQFSQGLHNSLLTTGVPILSMTYISMTIMTTILAFFLGISLSILYFSEYIALSLLFTILATIGVIALFYMYPSLLIRNRRKELIEERPFFTTHLAAIANTGIPPIAIFKTLLKSNYYKSLNSDLRRIINNVQIFGETLPQATRTIAKNIPSIKTKHLFEEIAEHIEKGKNLKHYLNIQSRTALSQYRVSKVSKKKRFFHTFQEELKVYKAIRFKKEHIAAILLALSLIVIDFVYFSDRLYLFVPFFLFAIAIAWIFILHDTYVQLDKNHKIETQFLWFVKDLKKSKDILSNTNNYEELNIHIQKLKNQYRIGIPLEKALTTFSKDTDNELIISAIQTSFEAKKYGANLIDALDQITRAKMIRKVLKTDRS